jgi:hypothetical protein
MLIKLWHVWLDIQQGRPVNDIHVLNMQDVLVNAEQPHDGEPDWIGARWSPGGKDSAWLGIHEGSDGELQLLDLVEMVEQNDVGKAVQVLQPFDKLGQDLDKAPNPGGPCGLDGHSLNILEWAMDCANGLIADVHRPIHCNLPSARRKWDVYHTPCSLSTVNEQSKRMASTPVMPPLLPCCGSG